MTTTRFPALGLCALLVGAVVCAPAEARQTVHGAAYVAAPFGSPSDDGNRYLTWRDSSGRLVRYDDRTARVARFSPCAGRTLLPFTGTGFGTSVVSCDGNARALLVDLRTGVVRPALGVAASDAISAAGKYWLRAVPSIADQEHVFVRRSTGERRTVTGDGWLLRDLDDRDLASAARAQADAVPSATLPAVLRRPTRFSFPQTVRSRGLRRTCKPRCEHVRVTSRYIAWTEARPNGRAAIYIFDRRAARTTRIAVSATESPGSTDATARPLLTRYGAFIVITDDGPTDSANQTGSTAQSFELYRVRR